MKILIIYFSRTGHTGKLAEMIAAVDKTAAVPEINSAAVSIKNLDMTITEIPEQCF